MYICIYLDIIYTYIITWYLEEILFLAEIESSLRFFPRI